MDGFPEPHSPQLLEANKRLHALREQIQTQRQATECSMPKSHSIRCNLPWGSHVSSESGLGAVEPTVLPSHLGWESEVLTAVLRRRQTTESSALDEEPVWINSLQEAFGDDCDKDEVKKARSSKYNDSPHGVVKLYPDIGLGMLRQEMTAPGRLWMMLRYLDGNGRGAIRIDIAAETLTAKTSSLRICGKRQLRNLLNSGEGIFWTRDKEHVWMYSAAKVACALNVERLTGQPVALPVSAILDGIGAFRAHLYSAFHSGRTKDTLRGEQAMPIARDTLAGLSGVGRSSQRAYEERVGLQVQANFAVGQLSTKENQEKQAWNQGAALFEIKDYRGQQGKKGKYYLAWQIPNSYVGTHLHRPKGRQKRINRELKDLVMKGMPGNVAETDETLCPDLRKRYFPNGKLAAKAYGRDPERELYWRQNQTMNRQFVVWQQLGGD